MNNRDSVETIYPEGEEFYKWSLIKNKRLGALIESDWTQFPDSPLTESETANWVKYRQKLRDIPQDYSDVEDIVWPTKPGE